MAPTFPLRPYKATYGREHPAEGYGRPQSITIDCHGHMMVPAADALVRPHLPATELAAVKFAGPAANAQNKLQGEARNHLMIGLDERLADMDRMGLDVMVMSPTPPHFNYQADAGLCLEASQLINDHLANEAAKSDRLVSIGTVPMQDTARAISEMERCMGPLGMPGIEIGAAAGDDELSAERLEPFWARAEELGATILLHPTAFASSRLSNHYFTNVIGNPLETTVAIHYLIFDGVMERYPGLKIVLAHGGAFAGAYSARMDHAWGARPDCRTRISRPPSTYLAQFYFDAIVFSNHQLAALVQQFGDDRVLIGTDYAFDMGEYDPIEHVLTTPGIDEAAAARICGLNAAKLFGIDPEKVGRANFSHGNAQT